MAGPAFGHVAYCGLPPQPDQLWFRWNLDPILLLALACIGAAYFVACRRVRLSADAPSTWRQALFYAGWLTGALALASPLCALSVSLFSARVGQHIILTLIAAPLVAAARPWSTLAKGLLGENSPADRLGGKFVAAPLASAGLFTVLIWLWHTPAAYDATFENAAVYWAMHLSLIGSALWLWAGLLDVSRTAVVRAIAAGLGSTVQMGLLGAVITLSPTPFYSPHFLTTNAWGLTPLADQQLGGAIMWAPGCAAFLLAAMWTLGRVLTPRASSRLAAEPAAR